MPIEHDDEATSFDPRPWGAQQRVLPRSNFARVSATLQETSIPAIPPLPIPVASRAITPLGVPTRMPTGTPAMASPIVAVSYMPRPMSAAFAFTPSVASGMPAFNAPIDSTLRVHRPALTLRSFIAVPIGAIVAIVLIATGYRATSTPRAAATIQLAAAQPIVAPVLPAAPRIAPMTPPPVEGVASFATPAAAAPTIPADARPPVVKRNGHKHSHRPRKIVAGDTSTPLGNLRPHRY